MFRNSTSSTPTERLSISSTGGASFTGNDSGTITHQFYNSNSGSGADTRVMIKTYANQGADPYIKFDSGFLFFI